MICAVDSPGCVAPVSMAVVGAEMGATGCEFVAMRWSCYRVEETAVGHDATAATAGGVAAASFVAASWWPASKPVLRHVGLTAIGTGARCHLVVQTAWHRVAALAEADVADAGVVEDAGRSPAGIRRCTCRRPLGCLRPQQIAASAPPADAGAVAVAGGSVAAVADTGDGSAVVDAAG